MEIAELEIGGRKYRAYVDSAGNTIVIGPPEGLVDSLGIPEPFSTKLHNILFARGMITYRDVTKKANELIGALQEALTLDAQRLQEAYYKYSQEVHND